MASVRFPFARGAALELDMYRIGEESPFVSPLARGVCASSYGGSEEILSGELMLIPLAALPAPLRNDLPKELFAGDDWKNSGDEVAGLSSESCDTLFARGVCCDCCESEACDASIRS